ncbi:MAG: SlyX protein [Paracoccaceae bacterium]|jgi:SlyX protein
MSENRTDKLEVAIAHLSQVVDELSDVAVEQAGEITVLTRRVQMLMERLADDDASGGDAAPLGDQKPPHW